MHILLLCLKRKFKVMPYIKVSIFIAKATVVFHKSLSTTDTAGYPPVHNVFQVVEKNIGDTLV